MSDETRVVTRMPTVLPSGDVYLGPQPGGRPDNVSATPVVPVDPVEAAIERAFDEGKHSLHQATITCPWCGQKYSRQEEFKTHVTAEHEKEISTSAEDERARQYALERRSRDAARGASEPGHGESEGDQ